MSEHIQHPGNRAPEPPTSEIIELLAPYGDVLNHAASAWQTVDILEAGVVAHEGRKPHPSRTIKWNVAKDTCYEICHRYMDTAVAEAPSVEAKVGAVMQVTAGSTRAMFANPERKVGVTEEQEASIRVAEEMQRARVAALGMQQIVYDELHNILGIDEYVEPFVEHIRGLVQATRQEQDTGEEHELLRLVATVYAQNPKTNILRQGLERIQPPDSSHAEDFLRTNFDGTHNLSQARLGATMRVLRTHVPLFEGNVEQPPATCNAASAEDRYIAWYVTQEWPPELAQGLSRHATLRRSESHQELRDLLAPFNTPDKALYRAA